MSAYRKELFFGCGDRRIEQEEGITNMKEHKKTGLVLEGGGMRGIYTAGVLDVFMDHSVHFDGVIGVSAGAIHGSSFVAGQKGRSIRYYKKYCKDKRFMSFWSLLRTGDIVGEQFCYHDLPERLDPFDYQAFRKADTEFYVTCSNVENGKAEYLRIRDMKMEMDLLRASASMPYVSKVVTVGSKKLLDGGCTDSIPVAAFQKMGFPHSVVVLTRHDGYVKKAENKKMAGFFYRKYPAFVKAIANRHLVYNQTLEQIRRMEQEGKIFVIRPSVELTIQRTGHDPYELEKTYQIGRMDAEKKIGAMLEWLAQYGDCES